MPKKVEKQSPICRSQQAGNNNKESVNTSRRKALKTIAAGTAVAGGLALSGKWSKPVVDTIILPAHAQATNPVGPAPTTPAPTTTSGECSPMIESACYTTTLDMQTGNVSSVTVTGNVNPAQVGVAITIQINAAVDGVEGARTDILHTTTNAAGIFSATQTYTNADLISEPFTISANGPCNGIDVPPCE